MKMDACTRMIADMAVSRARCDPTFLDRLEKELKKEKKNDNKRNKKD